MPADERLYARVKAEIGEQPPDGLVVHLVVKTDAGLRHTIVWESRQAWERFRDERVQPAVATVLSAAGFAQLPPRPAEHELDLVDVATGSGSRASV